MHRAIDAAAVGQSPFSLTQAHEEWGVALWLARKTEDEVREYVAFQLTRLENAGDDAGVAFWHRVCDRYNQLNDYSTLQ